jgi:hypothetical protein
MNRSLAAAGLAGLCLVGAGCKSGGTQTSSSTSIPPAAASIPAAVGSAASATATVPPASPGSASASVVASASAGSAAVASPSTSTSTPAAPAGKADKAHPCALVTPAEVQTALGGPGTITVINVDTGLYTNCTFKSADGNLILQISTFDDTDSKSAFEQNPNHLTAVSGVGGGAFTDPTMDLLSVWQNNVLINFQLNDNETNPMSTGQILAAEETVAKAAINRL